MSDNCFLQWFRTYNPTKDLYSGRLRVCLIIGLFVNGFILMILCSQLGRGIFARLDDLSNELSTNNDANRTLPVDNSIINLHHRITIAIVIALAVEICATLATIVLAVSGRYSAMSKAFIIVIIVLMAVTISTVFLAETVFNGGIEQELRQLLENADDETAFSSSAYQSIEKYYSCCSHANELGALKHIEDDENVTGVNSTTSVMQNIHCMNCFIALRHQFMGKVLVSCILAALSFLVLLYTVLIFGCLRRLNARVQVQNELNEMTGGAETGHLTEQQWDMMIPMRSPHRDH